MRFWSKVEVTDAEATLACLSLIGPTTPGVVAAALSVTVPEAGRAIALPDGGLVRHTGDGVDLLVPRRQLGAATTALIGAGAVPAGSWAADALRIPARRPRLLVDIDDRTIPNEVPWLSTAVHLEKGCYRGQETVARVHNLGRPARRLVMLNLDGSAYGLPETGAPVMADGRVVGRVGTVAQHHEDGPIALALVKRTIDAGVPLLAGTVDAVIDPADALGEGAISTPVSAIDRRAFGQIRRG
jgi:folate-binding protein YgfZ